MTDKIYFVSQDLYSEEDSEVFWGNMNLYTNLQDALDKLNNIYNNEPEFKWGGYCVRTFAKMNNIYVNTNEVYYHPSRNS